LAPLRPNPEREVEKMPEEKPEEAMNLETHRVGKAEMNVSIVLGRTQLTLEQVLSTEPGGVIELDRMSGQPVDILVNDTFFGKGEIVTVGDHVGVRITELAEPA